MQHNGLRLKANFSMHDWISDYLSAQKRAVDSIRPEAVAALGNDRNVIWCTGPSKTADVEGILIEGVHGPGAQITLVTG